MPGRSHGVHDEVSGVSSPPPERGRSAAASRPVGVNTSIRVTQADPSPTRFARRPSRFRGGEGRCDVAKEPSHSAIDAAVAEIHAAFGRAAQSKQFKLQVARWLRLEPQHPAVRARFAARAAALPQWDLAAAIREVERWWREERKTFALASALGYGSRLPLETLRELRLILRLLRRKRMAAEFAAIAAAVCDGADASAEAAE